MTSVKIAALQTFKLPFDPLKKIGIVTLKRSFMRVGYNGLTSMVVGLLLERDCHEMRQGGLVPVTVRTSTHELLIQQGYKLIDDAWSSNGRLTYDHNDDANREFIVRLAKALQSAGWETHPSTLRAFRHTVIAEEVIEIEPGGTETSGHFLHYMKAD